MEGVFGAAGFLSLILPIVTNLSSATCKVVGDIRKTKRAAQDPKELKLLQEELETWGQLLQSMENIKGSDGQVIIKAKSHCKKYERALRETKKCLERFRQTEDWQEITKILLDLDDQRKSVKRHREKVERWILSINTVVVNLTHEQLTRQGKRYSEAFDTQARDLESIRQQLQGIEALLKKSPQDHNAVQQMERASPVAELTAIADDLMTICSQQMVESVVGRGTRVDMCDGSDEEDASEVGSENSLEASSETRGHKSPTTTSQGTQTMLSYPDYDVIADPAISTSTPTSSRFRLEDCSNDESSWETDSGSECFSEMGSSSSSTADQLDGIEVLDRTRPDEDLDQYIASNAALKKLDSSTAEECRLTLAGSFGQATRGGPGVLEMELKKWPKGVPQEFWFLRGYTIGVAFERDWEPFQSEPGLTTLSDECKLHHLVRRVSFITRKPSGLDFQDLRQGPARGSRGFFAWNMTENCTDDECRRNLDLLCAESLIRVGKDSSVWESAAFCITVPWKLYRFWASTRKHTGVGYLVEQGLLAEIPIKIVRRDGQTWQRLWCPETVQGVTEIHAMSHEFSLPRPCGSFKLPRRFIVVVFKTCTPDAWVESMYRSLNMDPGTQIHYLRSDGQFDPPFSPR